MKTIRQQRKAIAPLQKIIGRPKVSEWTGIRAFKRIRRKRFKLLANIVRDDEFMSFCAMIGWVEVNWAMMEQQIDWWVKVVFVRLGGIPGEDKAPSGFWKKSSYLRIAFNTKSELSRFKGNALSVLDRADKLSPRRNEMTHAVITHLESKNGRYAMDHLKINRDGTHRLRPIVIDVRDFPKLSKDLAQLASDAIDLSRLLVQEFGIA